MKDYKLVQITWLDSKIESAAWAYIDEIQPSSAIINSTGYVINETKELITLAANISLRTNAETQVSSVITIPKCSIKKRKAIS